jgi:hypothetical protein
MLKRIRYCILLVLAFAALLSISTASVRAEDTPDPATVTIVGSLQSELGASGDWDPASLATRLTYDAADDVWQGAFMVPAGSWEYKVALNGSWIENYGINATRDGANISFTLSEAALVKFYYDHKTHWITDNKNSIIATVPGSFQSELGLPGDWDPAGLRSWLQDPDGDGTYEFSSILPPGGYECKVAIDESWTENYGAGGVQNGPNIPFTAGDSDLLHFTYDPTTHILSVAAEPLSPIGWCNLQFPPAMAMKACELSAIFYGQVWIDGVTSNPGPSTGMIAELGYGPVGSDPSGSSWVWTQAQFNTDAGNNDEYKARITVCEPGVYDYCFRYTYNYMLPVLGDMDGIVYSGELPGNPGKLTVTPADWIIEKSVSPTSQVVVAGQKAEFEWTVRVIKNDPLALPATLDDATSSMFPITVTDSTTFTYTQEYTASADSSDYDSNGTYVHKVTNTALLTWENALVTATSETEVICSLSPTIGINKVTCDAAASGDGILILSGETIKWVYTVTNTGIVPLENIKVTDAMTIAAPILVSGDDGDGILAPNSGESWVFEAVGTSVSGFYENTGCVSGDYVDDEGEVVATASSTDGSSYFGADPRIGIVKEASDEYGNVGDGIGIISGDKVTWIYSVSNSGNVPLGNVQVIDSISGIYPSYSTGDDGDGLLESGETWIFTAEGISADGLHANIGTAEGSFTDSAGHVRKVYSSDSSSYFGLEPGYLTNSGLCVFGDEFRIIFTPDVKNWPGTYRLSGGNPGQFSYNLFFNAEATGSIINVTLPYPFAIQGAKPVSAYSGVFVEPGASGICFKPVGETGDISFNLSSNESNLHISGLPDSGFCFVTIHLDFGLEGTTGWKKGKSDAAIYDRANFDPDYPDIMNGFGYEFVSPDVPGSGASIYNKNVFNNLKGFGGLVTDEMEDGVQGERIQLSSNGKLLETMTTDSNGWYFSKYVHKGKMADYSLKLLSTGEVIILTEIGGAFKYGEGNFTID